MFIIKEILSSTSQSDWVLNISGRVEKNHLNGAWMCAHGGLVKFSPTRRRPYSSCCVSSFLCNDVWLLRRLGIFPRCVFSEDQVPPFMRRFFSVTSGTCGWKRLQNPWCFLVGPASFWCVFFLTKSSRKIKYTVSAMNAMIQPLKTGLTTVKCAGNNSPSLKSFHQKVQLRVSNCILSWQLQLQSCLVWLGGSCTENKGCEQLHCMCESTRSLKAGNGKNISRFYSHNWAAGEMIQSQLSRPRECESLHCGWQLFRVQILWVPSFPLRSDHRVCRQVVNIYRSLCSLSCALQKHLKANTRTSLFHTRVIFVASRVAHRLRAALPVHRAVLVRPRHSHSVWPFPALRAQDVCSLQG